VSKVGVSALSRIQQREMDKARPDDGILINHVHPGYVDTDMTSHKGPLTTEQGADAATWLALLPQGENTLKGAYVWHDRKVLDWVSGTV
jgi:carbonyl reductase 1